jgi:tRNA1(Val) A37 N6-methylase TrmN6
MSHSGRKTSNELEFQGQVLEWLNAELAKRRGLGLQATQEKPRVTSGKRSDLIVWKSRKSEDAFIAIELKTPLTPITDAVFFADAIEKAQHWKAPYFAVWNGQSAELYSTPKRGKDVSPVDAIKRWPPLGSIRQPDDWLKSENTAALRALAIDILESALGHASTGGSAGLSLDAEVFVSRLTTAITQLRTILYDEITVQVRTKPKLRRAIAKIAAEQGFKGFVDDVDYAVAGQMGYRLVGQILFYFALRRKQLALPVLKVTPTDDIPQALWPYWNAVRRYDYEALFKVEPIDELVEIPKLGQVLVRTLITDFAAYDWSSLTDNVLGSIFEHLIPREEQVLLGQFYTPRPVADLLVAFTSDGANRTMLDPGCGGGTFLMSAYDYVANRTNSTHNELLSNIWGFDLSPFAAELAAINLFRQNLSEFENFPRIVTGNFFNRRPGEHVDFPPPKASPTSPKKIPIPVPHFDCIIGNPPYLRSQNQDDLDPEYRKQLFSSALRVGIKAEAKTDLFAFFIYHSFHFMKAGSRLGFVTPASWLTADYAASLQKLLLGELRLSAIIASSAESFFPQVDINAVLLVAERVDIKKPVSDDTLRFVTLKRPIAELVKGPKSYWDGVVALVDHIQSQTESFEDDRLRIKLIPFSGEIDALTNSPNVGRNWSKYLRAPLSYYALFGGAA